MSDFVSISTGWESDIHAFHLHYTENERVQDMSLILRIYPDDDAIEKSTREYAGMRQLHAIGYSVPQVFLREEANSRFDKPFIIMEKIGGEILRSFLDNAIPERGKQLLTLFCETFVQLHELDWRSFIDDPTHYEPGDGLVTINNGLALLRKQVEQFQQQGFLPCIDWVDNRKHDISCQRPSVIHLDFHAA